MNNKINHNLFTKFTFIFKKNYSLLKFGLRTRIYLSMLFVLLVSLVVIGVTTAYFFIEENEEYHTKRVSRKAKTIISSIQYFTKEVPIDASLDVVVKDFDEKVQELSDVNNININIFNTNGDILVSSYLERDENFYKNQVPSDILEQLKSEENIVREITEGEQKYLSSYSYAYNADNQKVGVIHIPYPETNELLKKDLITFLSTLLKIYVFLFIGGSLVAYFLSNYITRSLRAISDSLKNVGFDKKNEKLVWNSKDEIGALVEEYNKKLEELEESAEKLAKTERESAWREMAKQVAHEIKNPLTPMKLSIQHLERTYAPNDPEFQSRLETFSKNLIEQIDALSTIANEFSNFAKMPKAELSPINLIEIILSSVELYSKETNTKINFETKLESAIINGDKEQLLSVFSNLIKNSIQAIHDENTGIISLSINKESNTVLFKIQDNGIGISNDQKDKIFVPNFTTKSTGTGLGLAVVKNVIDSHDGRIWFESEENVGTTFFVSLPLKS